MRLSPLPAELGTRHDHLEQHGESPVGTQLLLHLPQQRLIRQQHRASESVTQQLAAQVPLELLPALLLNIIDQPGDSFRLGDAEFTVTEVAEHSVRRMIVDILPEGGADPGT